MKILLPVTHDLHRRNWLDSGAEAVLKARGHRVIVTYPVRRHPTIRRLLRLGSIVARARRGSRTYRHKLTLPRPLLDRAAIAAWHRTADPEGTARRIEARLPVPSEALNLLLGMRPNILLWPTLIHDDSADDLVKAARRLGVPVIAAPASWDTLTTKGAFLVRPDALLVWGEVSARHAERDHGFARGASFTEGERWQVAVTGPPHWDHYAEPRAAKPRTKVLIAGTSVAYWQDEADLAGRLTENFPGRVIYRRHPRRGGEWSWKACLELRDQLDETTVVVAAFSTVIVEAALQGVPSCIVEFGNGLPPLAEYEHMSDVISSDGVIRCDSYHFLKQAVNAILMSGATEHGVHLSRAWARKVADADGRCRERIAEALECYAARGSF